MVRYKNRYFLMEVIWAPPSSSSSSTTSTPIISSPSNIHFYEAIKTQIARLFGQYGLGLLQPSLTVKYTNMETNLLLLRCARDYHRMLWSSLTHVTEMNGKSVLLRILHVGGTIRTCRKFALHYDKAILQLLKSAIDEFGEEENDELTESVQEKDIALVPIPL